MNLVMRFDYRGPVYGAEKQKFFRDIHAKVFPTRSLDAQPLVIMEAFAHGRPVVSFAKGCIPDMLPCHKNGQLIRTANSFRHGQSS